jgi:hypothetical protein
MCDSGRPAPSARVAAELHHPAVLEHADPVGLTHRGEAVGDEDRGAPGGWRRAPAGRSPPRRARRAGRWARRAAPDPRPAPPRTAPGPGRRAATARRTDRCRRGSPWRAPVEAARPVGASRGQGALDGGVVGTAPHPGPRCRAAALEADEVLEHGGDATAPVVDGELAQIDAVDLDAARLRVVEAAQQLGEGGLARAVLADDGQRRPGRNGEVEVHEHRLAAAGVGEGHLRKRISRAGMASPPSAARRAARRPAASPDPDAARHRLAPRRRRAPRQATERDHAGTDGGLANTTTRSSPRAPLPAACASERTPARWRPPPAAGSTAPDARAAGWPPTAARTVAGGGRETGRPPSRPGRTGAAPWRPAARPPAGRRSRHGAGHCAPRRCCGLSTRRSRAAASGWRARRRRARAAPTRRRRTAPPPRRGRRSARPVRRR